VPESTGALADRTTEATVAPSLAARSSGFRPDIQAMRALAVGVVVLYHLWPERFPGGFIGVDVFFVISGYLITQHLMQEVARTGRISLTQFWARRIRRLLPAAFLVLGFSLVVLLVVMPPVTWGLNLEEIRASAAYVENWLLGFHAIDYLAAENSASLVQHYWSLAVEEQFYLLWPLLILAAVAVGRSSQPEQRVRRVRWVLAGVFLVSLALSIVATPKDPALAFFATPLRAWEFAAGGLLVMFVRQASQIDVRLRAALSWFGWIVIIGATLFMQGSHVQFPGWIALVPVVAAVCCLAAGDPSTRWAPGPADSKSGGAMDRRPLVFDLSLALAADHRRAVGVGSISHLAGQGRSARAHRAARLGDQALGRGPGSDRSLVAGPTSQGLRLRHCRHGIARRADDRLDSAAGRDVDRQG
jgi:peptidoglycan/LPS O-acetylase OafA/YrhL